MAQFTQLVQNLDLRSKDLEVGLTLDDASVKAAYGTIIELINSWLEAGRIGEQEARSMLDAFNLAGKIE